jgi:hypothetical protein
MKIRFGAWLLASSWIMAGTALANASPVSIEIVDAHGQVFREIPVNARDGALRSYLQARRARATRCVCATPPASGSGS